MAGEFPNQPRILRGAFVEYGLSLPPLFVVFQFNPEQIQRVRQLSVAMPGENQQTPNQQTQCHNESDLLRIRERQQVNVQNETISFQLRLDATDDLDEGNGIAETFGIAPRLSTLELMTHPKEDSLLGGLADLALGGLGVSGFSFTKQPNPPVILFIWGYKRVLPVNITSMTISETKFSTTLDPIRATVDVTLEVIQGKNIPYLYTRAAKEVESALNLANIAEIANVVVPG